MSVVAWAFLALLLLRLIVMFVWDDGFGGAAWTAIMLISSLAWVAALVMALHLLGVEVGVEVSRG